MVIVVVFVVALPFLGLTFTVTTQLPVLSALIDVPETLQFFLLLLATFAVALDFAGSAISISVARALILIFLPLASDGSALAAGATTVGAEVT